MNDKIITVSALLILMVVFVAAIFNLVFFFYNLFQLLRSVNTEALQNNKYSAKLNLIALLNPLYCCSKSYLQEAGLSYRQQTAAYLLKTLIYSALTFICFYYLNATTNT